jgi:dihydroorotase-like cyclic amidohydrolase
VVHADIEISDGLIVGVVPAGTGGRAQRTITGSGREAYPGLIDPHVHFRLEDAAAPGDGFADMAEAAARGGITSVLAFVSAPPDAVGAQAVRPVIEAAGESPIDFGLHHILWPRSENLAALPELVDLGVSSFKMFLAYPERGFMFDGEIAVIAMHRVSEAGGRMLVHCEDGNTIRWLDATARDRLGHHGDILDYLAARPVELEAVSVAQVGLWAEATQCPLYIVHLSTAEGVAMGRRLQEKGLDIALETCPQYLELDSSDLPRLGALAKFAPVLRGPQHREALWAAVEAGVISIIGTDHSGHRGEFKQRVCRERGIFDVPFGMPGLETLMPLLYTQGVLPGRISRPQLAALLSTNAARRFGWYPDKGEIRVGVSADLTLIDGASAHPVNASQFRSNAGYSPFDGRTLFGWPTTTVLHGEIVLDEGELHSFPGGFAPTGPARKLSAVPGGRE